MGNDPGPIREQEFQNRLLAAINEVRRQTRIGLTAILDDVQRIGGLQAAKNRLRARSHPTPPQTSALSARIFDSPSEYFLTSKRIARMDLSIEAIALEPKWRGLFTQEEIDEATATLSEHGFNPVLETPAVPMTNVSLRTTGEFSLAPLHLGQQQRGGIDEMTFAVRLGEQTECQVTRTSASALREGHHPSAHPIVRKHLGECGNCRDLHPELVLAFERFDRESLATLSSLLGDFRASMRLEDAQLEELMVDAPEYYEDPDAYAVEMEGIRPMAAWRAVRVGCHVGRFISAFVRTFEFDDVADLWLKWRRGEVQGSISTYVRGIDRQLFILGLAAHYLLLVRSWPVEDEGILFVPTIGDVSAVDGYIRVEDTCAMYEWEEVLGNPPQDLNLLVMLALAGGTAIATMASIEPTSELTPNRVSADREQLDRIEEMLRTMQTSRTEDLDRQDAIIAQLAGMLIYMKSTDRHSCEQSLLSELPGVYENLRPEVQSLLLASEQTYRIPGFAAPGSIVHGLASAFELQLRHSVLTGLFDHLKRQKAASLRPPPEWQDVEKRDKPLWTPGARADKCTLGEMKLILRHPQPTIQQFIEQFGFDRAAIEGAIEAV